MTNYSIAIACMNGICPCLAPFPELLKKVEG